MKIGNIVIVLMFLIPVVLIAILISLGRVNLGKKTPVVNSVPQVSNSDSWSIFELFSERECAKSHKEINHKDAYTEFAYVGNTNPTPIFHKAEDREVTVCDEYK